MEARALAGPSRVLLVRPPFRGYGKGRLLVVGCRQEETGLCLLIAYTEWERPPRPERKR